MWDSVKDWYHRNKSYLAMLFLASLGVGVGTACICLAFPAALPVLASISLLGLIPLAFLNTLPFALAVLALSSIMVAVSFVTVAVSMVVLKQLASISINLYESVRGSDEPNEAPLGNSHDYLHRHLKVESARLRHDSDDELDEISSDEMQLNADLPNPVHTRQVDDGHAERQPRSFSLS